jgi:hypothetical protein
MAKVDQNIARQRVAEMALLRIQGRTLAQCCDYARQNGWNTGYKQVWRYCDQADKQIAKQIQRRQTQLIAWGVNQRNRAIEMALEDRDYDAALKLMQDRDKLLGLYPKEEPEKPPTQVQNNVFLSDVQRAQLEAALLRRLGDAGASAKPVGAKAADGRVLPGAAGDHGRCGEAAGPVAERPAADAAAGDVITVQPAERPVPPVRRTESPVLAGPPGPGEERSVCLECGRRYLRQQPGVVFRCPACNAP